MLDEAKFADPETEIANRTWGTSLNIGGQVYATSLFWQPLQNQEDPLTEITEASEGILEGADLYCLKPGKAPQFGICVSQEGYRSGQPAAAVTLATALADRSSFIAVFRVKEGWWYTCVRNDIILSDGDMLFFNEDDAKNQFMSMLAVPDWGRKIAPEEWNIEDAEHILLEHLMQRGNTAKLQKIKGLRGAKLLMIIGISLIIGLWLLSSLIDALFFSPAKRPVVVPVQPKVVKKVEAVPVIKPWETIKDPTQIMTQCSKIINQLQMIMPPGWNIQDFKCSQTGVTTSWKRDVGRMSWIKKALDNSDIDFAFENFSNTGDILAVGVDFSKIEKISSPPMKSLPDLREMVNNLFQTIGQKVSLTNGVFAKKNKEKKNTYRYLGFSFTSQYDPIVWSELLTKFSGLEIKVINYNGNEWKYEGAIYAL